MGSGLHGPELLTLQPSGYLKGTEVWLLNWSDGSVGKVLPCKLGDMSSTPRTYILKDGYGACI